MGNTIQPTPQPKRCLGCGYILEGLSESRCPECGRPFDPGDRSTYLAKPRSGWAYVAGALFGGVAIATPLLVGHLVDIGSFAPSPHLALILAPLMISAFVAQCLIARATARALLGPPGFLADRRPWVAGLILSSLIGSACLIATLVEATLRVIR